MLQRFKTIVFAAAVAFVAAGCTQAGTAPSGDASAPKQAVSTFMDALVAEDYAKALALAGITVPAEIATQINTGIKSQAAMLTLKVTRYTIKDASVNGGLALVSVEETSTREAGPQIKAGLAQAGDFGTALKWGEVTTTTRYVLVNLDGKWVFDTVHSGFDSTRLPLEALSQAAQTKQAPAPDTQKQIAEAINNTSIGQVIQTLGATGPVVPIVAAIAIPNFVAARGQAQLTACKSNLKNIGTALEMYSTDNSGLFPATTANMTPDYLRSIPTCPAAGRDTYSTGLQTASNPDAYTFVCTGKNHEQVPENFPQYNSTQGLIER